MTRSGKPFDEEAYNASRAPELISDLQATMTQARLLHAQLLDTIAEMDREGIVAVTGYSRLPHLVAEVLRVPAGQARSLVEQAGQVAESWTPTGHTTPAPLPTVRVALHEGLVDGQHIEAIAKTVKDVPDTAPLGSRELVESTLAEAARTLDAKAVLEQGKVLLQHLDAAGTHPNDRQPEPRNSFAYQMSRDGRMRFKGEIEPETPAVFEELLDKCRTPDGGADPRSKRERLGDAFCDLVDRAANPDGDAKAQLVVSMNIDWLIDGIGTATLDTGCKLAPAAVRRLSCDAELIPLVLNGESVPLDLGRSRRLVTSGQRKALVARDQGCAFPGCCNPARWADAHHVQHWIDGGVTDVDNLVLLCRRHHRELHHSAWEVRMTSGFPEFIPPQWIDPQRTPLRNTVHLRP